MAISSPDILFVFYVFTTIITVSVTGKEVNKLPILSQEVMNRENIFGKVNLINHFRKLRENHNFILS